jgi:hypothetical protein
MQNLIPAGLVARTSVSLQKTALPGKRVGFAV